MRSRSLVKTGIALVLCVGLSLPGCASVSGTRYAGVQQPTAPGGDTSVMSDYVQKLPLGTRVRVDRTTGGALKGTLMKATAESIVVQRNTRVPEPPVEIPIAQIARVTVDSGNGGLGRAIAISAGVGAGATLGFLLLLAALIGD